MLRPISSARKPSHQWRDAGFIGRSLVPTDANEKYLGWVADAKLMNALNMPARKLSLEELKAHINHYDQKNNILAGVFKDGPGAPELVGVFVWTINPEHRIARVSGFLGDSRAAPNFIAYGKSVFTHLFEMRGVEKIGAQVATTNKAAMAACWALGMHREGLLKGEIRNFDGSGRSDQIAFGLLREDWRAVQKAAAAPQK